MPCLRGLGIMLDPGMKLFVNWLEISGGGQGLMFAHVGACCWLWLRISSCIWKCRTGTGFYDSVFLPVISSGTCCGWLFGRDAVLGDGHMVLGVPA